MFNISIKQLFLFVFISLMIVACSDDSNPTKPTTHEDGLVVSGFDSDYAIVEVHSHDHEEEEEEEEEEHADADGFFLENDGEQEIYRQFQGAVTGSINVAQGETVELFVHFLDSEEEEIPHDEEHEMEIEITGVAAGTTTFSMELWHDGHIDWTSTNLIQITVTE